MRLKFLQETLISLQHTETSGIQRSQCAAIRDGQKDCLSQDFKGCCLLLFVLNIADFAFCELSSFYSVLFLLASIFQFQPAVILNSALKNK